MQHIGDLQPIRPPDYMVDHAPHGRYSARRSRWRLSLGALELGFDRASERIEAETPRPASPGPQPDFGWRLMALVGTLTTAALLLAVAGWLWSTRGGSIMGGETVSAAIIDRAGADLAASAASAGPAGPTVIPTARKPVHLRAVIEQRKAAPAMAPAPRAAVPIADGRAIRPQPPVESGRAVSAPDEAIINSGNFLLIPPVARAVAQAIGSGEAQNWVAGDYHGVVVVGEAVPRDGKACRQGTVLLRDGSAQGRTQRFERCTATKG
ncbi:MAG: hypothetical protein BGP16_08970 [Sphingobium sp. 66-54]|nr:MAG: hypothetical protein BGP16_08970 [Sphingobium sp. 66-54]